ncbi:MAG: ABC transporter substrate-binding protein [Lachnospiraceae bacterium]|nr:ABC transporter substrate-binding protein [Lachnospiraceae bacterium]
MKNKKRLLALAMTASMAATMMVGCGSKTTGNGSGKGSEAASNGSAAGITIYNSKTEIQSQMEDIAKAYTEETGVPVEVTVQGTGSTVATDLSTAYASGNPYTISMVDAKDIYSMGKEHAVDLSGEEWTKNTNYAIGVDGATYGMPVCIEARSVIYNATAIKNITGEDFDPASCQTLDGFKEVLQKLADGGMEQSTGILNEDWSLGAHYLAEVYEENDDTEKMLQGLHDGTIDIAEDKNFNNLMDTFDVLMEHNYAKGSEISAEREVTEQKLAEGEIAFMFGGNWDWSVLNAYDYTDGLGMMPVPQNTDGKFNTLLVGGGSKYFFVDNSATEEQQKQAKDFLNWLVTSEAGQDGLVNKCALVPAFTNITLPVADPLGKSVKEYADAGRLLPSYDYLPDDHYAKLGGTSFQKYLAGQSDRATFASEINDYWKSATLSQH